MKVKRIGNIKMRTVEDDLIYSLFGDYWVERGTLREAADWNEKNRPGESEDEYAAMFSFWVDNVVSSI